MFDTLRQMIRGDVASQREATYVDGPFFPFTTYGSPEAHKGLALPAFFRGVRLRSDLISTLPLVATYDDVVLDVVPPILAQPDPTEDRTTTIAKMEASLILHGEVVAVLGDWDELGFPNVLKVVHPHDAQLAPPPRPGERWVKSWTIGGRTYGADEVLHIVPFALPGELRGVGALELHRRTIEGELTAQAVQRSFHEDGAMPSQIIHAPAEWSPTELADFKSQWMAKLRGRREPIVLPDNITSEPFSISQADAQWVESRQLALVDIAAMVGVPAHYLGWQGSSRTYTNALDERRDLIDLHLRGSVYGIERGCSTLVPVVAKFDTGSFLRLNERETAEVLRIEGAWTTVDEIRAIKRMPPLPDGRGSMLMVDANTQSAPIPTPEVEPVDPKKVVPT